MPEGSSRVLNQTKDGAAKCAVCKHFMEKLDIEAIASHLTPPEQAASRIGSVDFDGWQCPTCYPNLTRTQIHNRAYVINDKNYTSCSTCNELTVERTSKVLEAPNTRKKVGV